MNKIQDYDSVPLA